jgi:hypothetical protein
MNPTANRRNSGDDPLREVAAALDPSLRQRKRADSSGSDEPCPSVDHDDLLVLLERPRPHHGDLRALLRRTQTRKQADIGIPISGAQDDIER